MHPCRHPTVAAAAVLALLAPALAVAEDKPGKFVPSPGAGRTLAERLCSSCHAVEGVDSSVPAGIPSMKGLANRPEQTEQRVKAALLQPHAPMPDMRLSLEEIGHLVAYLDSLRTAQGLAPLLPAAQPEKPKYPKPS